MVVEFPAKVNDVAGAVRVAVEEAARRFGTGPVRVDVRITDLVPAGEARSRAADRATDS